MRASLQKNYSKSFVRVKGLKAKALHEPFECVQKICILGVRAPMQKICEQKYCGRAKVSHMLARAAACKSYT
jgi:hypothetical protein